MRTNDRRFDRVFAVHLSNKITFTRHARNRQTREEVALGRCNSLLRHSTSPNESFDWRSLTIARTNRNQPTTLRIYKKNNNHHSILQWENISEIILLTLAPTDFIAVRTQLLDSSSIAFAVTCR